ncbi:hypothetical protein BDV38DRAFT_55905 [Aspergillus pseudotamarii]|uniref:Uncharacterized protein n=1 Tax=Aspergillus pseudotamarii TaxID=132259 RepID=A0A5N6SZU4_ASPPS|nr:uncharacterized protein BDV38DRAFT_55905 [Aspergillus pseudotamarii]KAE8139271.1 hypothetical protein BDV38DRAFT_55905 [Aspergillus pseudotamarii]
MAVTADLCSALTIISAAADADFQPYRYQTQHAFLRLGRLLGINVDLNGPGSLSHQVFPLEHNTEQPNAADDGLLLQYYGGGYCDGMIGNSGTRPAANNTSNFLADEHPDSRSQKSDLVRAHSDSCDKNAVKILDILKDRISSIKKCLRLPTNQLLVTPEVENEDPRVVDIQLGEGISNKTPTTRFRISLAIRSLTLEYVHFQYQTLGYSRVDEQANTLSSVADNQHGSIEEFLKACPYILDRGTAKKMIITGTKMLVLERLYGHAGISALLAFVPSWTRLRYPELTIFIELFLFRHADIATMAEDVSNKYWKCQHLYNRQVRSRDRRSRKIQHNGKQSWASAPHNESMAVMPISDSVTSWDAEKGFHDEPSRPNVPEPQSPGLSACSDYMAQVRVGNMPTAFDPTHLMQRSTQTVTNGQDDTGVIPLDCTPWVRLGLESTSFDPPHDAFYTGQTDPEYMQSFSTPFDATNMAHMGTMPEVFTPNYSIQKETAPRIPSSLISNVHQSAAVIGGMETQHLPPAPFFRADDTLISPTNDGRTLPTFYQTQGLVNSHCSMVNVENRLSNDALHTPIPVP